MSDDVYRYGHKRTTDEFENDDAEPNTKRVLAYVWDGNNKVRLSVNASGQLKVTI